MILTTVAKATGPPGLLRLPATREWKPSPVNHFDQFMPGG